jgi:hypothetical protein
MASIVDAPPSTAPAQAEVAEAILEALAEVRAEAVTVLRAELGQADGDMEIDSREAEAVIAILETRFGRPLANVEDLEPECLPSVATLAELIGRRWAETAMLPFGTGMAN